MADPKSAEKCIGACWMNNSEPCEYIRRQPLAWEAARRALGVKACRYTNEPGGACWREGKAVEICTCHSMTDNDFAESVKRHAECRAPLGNAGVAIPLTGQEKNHG